MNFLDDKYPFEVKPLPYAYDALEPFIDEETMRVHHDRHYKKYVDSLNAALKDYPQCRRLSLFGLLKNVRALPYCIQNSVIDNGGGVINHELYFYSMTPPEESSVNRPDDMLLCMIERKFGSFEEFEKQFKLSALSVFGSGYSVLCADEKKRVKIVKCLNQATAIPLGLKPLLPADVWEHAYYLKHQNDRAAYIDDWFNVINWQYVKDLLIG